MRLIKWGLTGGVGAGKSLAAKYFRAEGITVIDLDQLSRELIESDPKVRHAIQGLFDQKVLLENGQLDRQKIRELVFKDPKKRIQLEQVLHPKILKAFDKKAEECAASGKKLILCEAALLVESGYHRHLDGLIVVTAPLPLRRERLMKRDKITGDLADAILAAQLDEQEKTSKAQIVLSNAGASNELMRQVKAIVEQWKVGGLL